MGKGAKSTIFHISEVPYIMVCDELRVFNRHKSAVNIIPHLFLAGKKMNDAGGTIHNRVEDAID